MRRSVALLGCALALTALAARAEGDGPSIAFEKFTLDNGLTVIVHEDHKAPIVAVNVWYHVGSKNEKPGRTGFAHLFEHLMFNGSENYDLDYFKLLEPLGATELNGTTNEDRTNYFESVPRTALDTVLWAESDRMGHLLGAVTQEKLDEQRGVVQNEKRQFENQPYSVAFELITKATYPAGHPYSWTVIGSMEDLDAAALEDVHAWFQTYYGPSNAVLAIAGDITVAEARAKVEKYFGDIPPGPPVAHHEAWVARRSGTQRQRVEDRVPQARLYKVWNVPEWGTPEADYLELLADVLSSGKTSRLYRRLVYEDQIATQVRATLDEREIGSQFQIQATAKPGADLTAVEAALDEELGRLLREGPTPEEVDRARTRTLAAFVRGSERIGGFLGKSNILARNQVYAGDPGYFTVRLDRIRRATTADLKAAGQWITDGAFVLEVVPFPEWKAAEAGADRSAPPEPGTPPAPRFPDLQRATLDNGLRVIVAERRAVPVVELELLVDAGYASDITAAPGIASMALDMLDEGTASRTALEISDAVDTLGARLRTSSNVDQSVVSISALKENLGTSLELFADVIRNPSFPEGELERLRKQRLAAIQREKVQPFNMALRVFPKLLYGDGHPYGTPLTGSGTEASVSGMSRADLVAFHDTWFKPNNATLVVVGDASLAEIRPMLEERFRDWRRGKAPEKPLRSVSLAERSRMYVIDRPGSIQSLIIAGHVAPPKANPDEIAIAAMNDVLGGSFTSRVNMNLREDKHWSYGAQTILWDAKGQRPFFVYAPVQTDKTRESVAEVLKELQGIRGDHPATPEELDRVKRAQTLRLPGSWETNANVADAIGDLVRYGYPDDYYRTYPDEVGSLTLSEVRAAAQSVIHPDQAVWLVVGDRKAIEPGLRELGFQDIQILDADGSPVEEKRAATGAAH